MTFSKSHAGIFGGKFRNGYTDIYGVRTDILNQKMIPVLCHKDSPGEWQKSVAESLEHFTSEMLYGVEQGEVSALLIRKALRAYGQGPATPE